MHYCDTVHLGGHGKYVLFTSLRLRNFMRARPADGKYSEILSPRNCSKKNHNFRFYTLSQGCIHLCNFYFYSFLHWTRDKEKIRYSTTFEEYYEWKSESSNAKTVHLVYLLTLNSRDFTALPNRVFRFQSNTGRRREQNIFSMAALIWPMLFAQFGKKLFNLNSSI